MSLWWWCVTVQATRTSWFLRTTRRRSKAVASSSAVRQKRSQTTWRMSGGTTTTTTTTTQTTWYQLAAVRRSTLTAVWSLHLSTSPTPAGTPADQPTASDWHPRPELTSTSHVSQSLSQSSSHFDLLPDKFIVIRFITSSRNTVQRIKKVKLNVGKTRWMNVQYSRSYSYIVLFGPPAVDHKTIVRRSLHRLLTTVCNSINTVHAHRICGRQVQHSTLRGLGFWDGV